MPKTPIQSIHHVAIICSNYKRSKFFYTAVLGLTIIQETYREKRDSYKLDLELNGQYVLELFSFPSPPPRLTRPEATGLRHLAFAVADLEEAIRHLEQYDIPTEPIRIDELTQKRFVFFEDPDHLPIEFYETLSFG
ncbi:VOC family protein [Olivibacter ginsenosidimutans]|uniref:VOC family protein n=1 Tax=Olivibacter ginsenosidimutans TaxID=1176537 RepID=A0ABP9C499_9SPHI